MQIHIEEVVHDQLQGNPQARKKRRILAKGGGFNSPHLPQYRLRLHCQGQGEGNPESGTGIDDKPGACGPPVPSRGTQGNRVIIHGARLRQARRGTEEAACDQEAAVEGVHFFVFEQIAIVVELILLGLMKNFYNFILFFTIIMFKLY